ncbi:MAG: dihydroorotate dehydrogenase, partial [Clostridia bacterium]|nr:dihydroorotate dehydrogenase [Clostridia bacterium]
MVWQVKNAVSIPIIGMGGIATGEDAAEFMLAGATLTAVGTMSLVNPDAPYTVVCGFKDYMKKYGIENAADLIGGVIPN